MTSQFKTKYGIVGQNITTNHTEGSTFNILSNFFFDSEGLFSSAPLVSRFPQNDWGGGADSKMDSFEKSCSVREIPDGIS